MSYELWHGDCLVEMDRIVDASIDMILCDLPFQMTACKWDILIPFEPLWAHYKRIIKPNGAIVLFGSQPFTSQLVMSNLKWFKYEWIWEKNRGSNFASVKYMPMKEHENILVFCSGSTRYYPIQQERAESGKSRSNYGFNPGTYKKDYIISNLITIQRSPITKLRVPRSIQKFNTETGKHPTQKPVALCEYLIKTYTNEGELVLDNCMGSGSVGVACLNLNRNFIGIEKDDKYFQVASDRMANHIVKPVQMELK